MFTQYPLTLLAGQSSGTVQISIGFLASFIAIQNPSQAMLYFASGRLAEQPQSAQPVMATKSITAQMQSTQDVTIWWTASGPLTSSETVILQFSDQPIQMQVSDNGIVYITTAPNTTVEIAGTPQVEITGTPTMEISGPVTIQSIQEDVNSQIINGVVPENDLIYLGSQQWDNVTLANNQGVTMNVKAAFPGLYDGFFAVLTSANSVKYSFDTLNPYINPRESGLGPPVQTGTVPAVLLQSGPQTIGRVNYPQQAIADGAVMNIWNYTGASVTDTLYIDLYGIRATVSVNNPTDNPAITQASVGSFDDNTAVAGVGWSQGDGTLSLISSALGGYFKTIYLVCFNFLGYAIEVNLLFESTEYSLIVPAQYTVNGYTVQGQAQFSFTLGNGIPNNGLNTNLAQIYGPTPASGTLVYEIGGLVTYNQLAGSPIPATLQ